MAKWLNVDGLLGLPCRFHCPPVATEGTFKVHTYVFDTCMYVAFGSIHIHVCAIVLFFYLLGCLVN